MKTCLSYRLSVLVLMIVGAYCSSCAHPPSSPQEIVALMTNAYATCGSYEDSGEMINVTSFTPPHRPESKTSTTNSLPFRIQFRHPSSLHLEFTQFEAPPRMTAADLRNRTNWPTNVCVLYSDGRQELVFSKKSHAYFRGTLSSNPFQNSDISQGRGQAVRSALAGNFKAVFLDPPDLLREDVFEGTRCDVLRSSNATEIVEYWIGQQDHLLRKRRCILNTRYTSGTIDENHRDIRIHTQIPDSTFIPDLPKDATQTTNIWSLLSEPERNVFETLDRMAAKQFGQTSTQQVPRPLPPESR